jgi:hypothetical protein
MSRRRAPLFGGNTTFAGFAVTVTVCIGALALLLTGCVMLVRAKTDQDISAGREMVLQGVAALGLALGLLSRTRQDPAATVEQPATVTATPTAE